MKELGARPVILNLDAKKTLGKKVIKNNCNQWKTMANWYLS